MSDPAFTLRVKLPTLHLHDRDTTCRTAGCNQPRQCTITAYDGFLPSDIDENGTGRSGSNPFGWTSGWDSAGRIKLTCEVKHGSEVIFPAGQLTCALHACSDSIQAKELVMALVSMHPSAGGGEGDDYYKDYTPAQLVWVEQHGEALDMERMSRYCDESGECRKVG